MISINRLRNSFTLQSVHIQLDFVRINSLPAYILYTEDSERQHRHINRSQAGCGLGCLSWHLPAEVGRLFHLTLLTQLLQGVHRVQQESKTSERNRKTSASGAFLKSADASPGRDVEISYI